MKGQHGMLRVVLLQPAAKLSPFGDILGFQALELTYYQET
jgi:hypothetical protein